jgi:hypothetical protein
MALIQEVTKAYHSELPEDMFGMAHIGGQKVGRPDPVVISRFYSPKLRFPPSPPLLPLAVDVPFDFQSDGAPLRRRRDLDELMEGVSSAVMLVDEYRDGMPSVSRVHDEYMNGMPSVSQVNDEYMNGMPSVSRVNDDYKKGMPSVSRVNDGYESGLPSVSRISSKHRNNMRYVPMLYALQPVTKISFGHSATAASRHLPIHTHSRRE